MADEIELTDSINDAAAKDLRVNAPDLFGGPSKAESAPAPAPTPAAPQWTAEELEAIANEEDELNAKGRFVPRARVDELTAQRNSERERREAAEARAAKLESDRQAEARAAEEAAAKAVQQRDFDTERDALQAKYDKDEIDAAEFRKQSRALDKDEREQIRRGAVAEAIEQMEQRTSERVRAQHQETLQRASEDLREAAERFLSDPENGAYKDDQFRIAAFNVAKEEIWAESGGNIGWDELLQKSRERVEGYFEPKKPAGQETSAERTARERRERAAHVAAEASTLPARPNGGMGSRGLTNKDSDNVEGMSRTEWAKLPQEERNRLLGKVA